MKKMVKKCSTDQRFIRKRNTTYKIGTLNDNQLSRNFRTSKSRNLDMYPKHHIQKKRRFEKLRHCTKKCLELTFIVNCLCQKSLEYFLIHFLLKKEHVNFLLIFRQNSFQFCTPCLKTQQPVLA